MAGSSLPRNASIFIPLYDMNYGPTTCGMVAAFGSIITGSVFLAYLHHGGGYCPSMLCLHGSALPGVCALPTSDAQTEGADCLLSCSPATPFHCQELPLCCLPVV